MAKITQTGPDTNGSATVLNKNISSGNATVLNSKISNTDTTVLNTQLVIEDEKTLKPGDIICGTYKITKKLSITAGEADLYLCHKDNKEYVAKVYRREVSIKPEVVTQLKSMYSPYIARIIETGEYNGCAIEIQPYYKNGSLSGKTFSFEELKNNIIPSLNEGLKVLHDNGIIHKDLKPSNIMLADNGKDVVIIDFGISSVKTDGITVLVTKTGMTPVYSAPETFKSLFLDISDYYSLGITLYELFCGRTPYGNMPNEEMERYMAIQKLPFPENMPQELQDLIKALTYNDITNRDNKDNPNRRWGYREVSNWLNGIKQTLPGEGIGAKEIKPYLFMKKQYKDRISLIHALIEYWDEGKKELYRGNLSNYFKNYDPSAEKVCLEAEKEIETATDKEDLIFFKTMYRLNRKKREFYWKGRIYEGGLSAFGIDILDHLWADDHSIDQFIHSILINEVLSTYISLINPNYEKQINMMQLLEKSYKIHNIQREKIEKQKDVYRIGYALSKRKIFKIRDKEFSTIGELKAYMNDLLEDSLKAFQDFCHELVDYDGNLIPQFECWLTILGKKENLNKWKESL